VVLRDLLLVKGYGYLRFKIQILIDFVALFTWFFFLLPWLLLVTGDGNSVAGYGLRYVNGEQ
jgi:hypothetical protein